jgi:hypothetical protein
MMFRLFLLGGALSASIGGYALAQTAATQPPSAPPAAGATVDSAVANVKPGTVVKDANGATVGTVVRVGQTNDGQIAVVVSVDGQPVNLASNILTPAADGLVSSMTKAQIMAAAKAAG